MDIEKEIFELSSMLKIAANTDVEELDIEEIQSYFKVLSDKADKIYINMIDTYLKSKGDWLQSLLATWSIHDFI